MNPKQTMEIAKAVHTFRLADQKVRIFEKINTSLPKKKARKFDDILKPLYAERTVARFNANQLINKANRGNHLNTNQ